VEWIDYLLGGWQQLAVLVDGARKLSSTPPPMDITSDNGGATLTGTPEASFRRFGTRDG